MKQLTCEMCGSTDLLKQDGVFVCQTCGTKYSVEEAKKMMVEVSGVVNVANMAQTESLINLANSSFESQNYEKAEEFCNQVLAIDDKNYEAWTLKAKSINGQIGVNNPRIEEVYNCVISAYNSIGEDEKTVEGFKLLSWLMQCFVGEIEFWNNQIEAQRPSEYVVLRAKNSYIDCWNKMKKALKIMEFPKEEGEETFLNNLDNIFIASIATTCISAWKTTVAYNYFRDYNKEERDPFKCDTVKSWDANYVEYRPTEKIWRTFIEESDNLEAILEYAVERFNEKTSTEFKIAIYNQMILMEEDIIVSGCWEIKYYSFDNSTRWYRQSSLADSARDIRREIIKKYKEAIKEIEEKDRQKKFDEYWSAHQEEKIALEKEKNDLEEQIAELEGEIEQIPGKDEIKKLEDDISNLESEKSSIGLFKLKEKKAVQEKIDAVNEEVTKIKDRMEKEKSQIEKIISPIMNRLNEICDELEKDR